MGATRVAACGCEKRRISIHAPRMGSDMSKCLHRASSVSFQSTLPHGERSDIAIKAVDNMDFNPRSPHGERPFKRPIIIPCSTFQSTPPAWGATTPSIYRSTGSSFQSTPPAWGATYSYALSEDMARFQSTPPAWGATT